VTNPLPLPFLLLLQVIIGGIEVRECAAHYLLLPGRRRVGAPEAQDLVRYGSTLTISEALQWVQPALRACAALHA
jgi:hypothetical protein